MEREAQPAQEPTLQQQLEKANADRDKANALDLAAMFFAGLVLGLMLGQFFV